jgi:site-specific recombinase XerD
VGIAMSESGVDLADIQQAMGHKHISTTRAHYVPVINARLQAAGKTLEGRLPWKERKNTKQK